MTRRYSREGWHPQGDDFKPKLPQGEVLGNSKGLKTMCQWEHKQKLADIAKCEDDGLTLTKAQKAYKARVFGGAS